MDHFGQMFFKECVLDGSVFVRQDTTENMMNNIQDLAKSRGCFINRVSDPDQVDISRLLNPSGRKRMEEWNKQYAKHTDSPVRSSACQ